MAGVPLARGSHAPYALGDRNVLATRLALAIHVADKQRGERHGKNDDEKDGVQSVHDELLTGVDAENKMPANILNVKIPGGKKKHPVRVLFPFKALGYAPPPNPLRLFAFPTVMRPMRPVLFFSSFSERIGSLAPSAWLWSCSSLAFAMRFSSSF